MEPTAPQQTGPRIGPWLSEAFNLFGQAWQIWLVHGLLAALPLFLFAGLALGPPLTRAIQGHQVSWQEFGVWSAVALLAMMLLLGFLAAAMIGTGLQQLRGERPSLARAFRVRDLGRVMAVFLIWYFLQTIGCALCLLPWLLAAALLLYAPVLVIDRGMGVGAACRESMRVVGGNLWMYVLWVLLIVFVINAGGLATCGLGMLATLPIGVLMLVVGYRDAIGLAGEIGAVVGHAEAGNAPGSAISEEGDGAAAQRDFDVGSA